MLVISKKTLFCFHVYCLYSITANKIGFTTTKIGSPCQPCNSHTFDKKYSGICNCNATER